MEFRSMEYIVQVAKSGSVSRTAERLFVSQSTISKSIKKTEEKLGVVLFSHVGNRLVPTYAGRQFVQHANEILLQKRDLEREMEILSGEAVGALSVAFPPLRISYMLPKVLPVFHQIYMELGSDLTGFAGAMMRFSDALNQYLFVIVIVLIAAAAGIFLIFRSDAGQKFFKKRPLALSTAASRFANCMALALSSGLDTDQGLMLAEQLVDNPYMASRIKKCRDLTASGRGFAEAVLTSGIFSKIYTSMITIGFRTGSMDEVMHQISEEYEEETDKQIAKFISVLEPTLVIILSIFIGLILISFLLPLIGIMSSIG